MSSPNHYTYCIVGAGLAGASAVQAIRKQDHDGSIVLIGKEGFRPYHRPPLSKELWFGKKTEDEVYVHDDMFYADNRIDLKTNTVVEHLYPDRRTVVTLNGETLQYEKLLLATGGTPTTVPAPGGDLEDIFYYRNLDDYHRLRESIKPGSRALVIGGGFIGSEIAAALCHARAEVTMLFPEQYMCGKLFPEEAAQALQEMFREKGITILSEDVPETIKSNGNLTHVGTRKGVNTESDVIVAGVGISPNCELADKAGLENEDGVWVNEFLQTSDSSIYAAGDCCSFYYHPLQTRARLEHWDAAATMGRTAGHNMAGGRTTYQYLPYFFSDLFDFGYEAVGLINPSMKIIIDWKDGLTGTIYYHQNGAVRGVMMLNEYGKLEEARSLLRGDFDGARTLVEGTGNMTLEELKNCCKHG